MWIANKEKPLHKAILWIFFFFHTLGVFWTNLEQNSFSFFTWVLHYQTQKKKKKKQGKKPEALKSKECWRGRERERLYFTLLATTVCVCVCIFSEQFFWALLKGEINACKKSKTIPPFFLFFFEKYKTGHLLVWPLSETNAPKLLSVLGHQLMVSIKTATAFTIWHTWWRNKKKWQPIARSHMNGLVWWMDRCKRHHQIKLLTWWHA